MNTDDLKVCPLTNTIITPMKIEEIKNLMPKTTPEYLFDAWSSCLGW